MKSRLIMLVPHDPKLDPRIHWEAAAASDRFDVSVLSYANYNLPPSIFDYFPSSSVVNLYSVRSRFSIRLRFLIWWIHFLTIREIIFAIGISLMLATVAVATSAALMIRTRIIKKPALEKWYLENKHWFLPRGFYNIFVFGSLIRYYCSFALSCSEFLSSRITLNSTDIIHANDLLALLPGVIAKDQFKIRLIYDAHEDYPGQDPSSPWYLSGIQRWLEAKLIHCADTVVTVSPPLAQYFERIYNVPRVYSVPNAAPYIPLTGDRNRYSIREVAKGRVSVLFQGNFGPNRGIEQIIDAWSSIEECKAVLFIRGPNSPAKINAIDRAARTKNLNRSVFFLESVDEDDLIEAASVADIGLIPYLPTHPCHKFACPNKLSQYMHAGLMILSSNLDYVKEVVEKSECGLIYDPSDMNTFIAAVTKVSDDRKLLTKFQINAKKYGHEHFHWGAFYPTLEAAYLGNLLSQ